MRCFLIRVLSFLRLRRLTSAMRAADEWETRAARLDRSLAKRRRELVRIQSELQETTTRLAEDLRHAEQLESQHASAIESLRSENKVLADTTIPALVASHQLLLKHYDAEAAIEVRRLVAASGRREEEM